MLLSLLPFSPAISDVFTNQEDYSFEQIIPVNLTAPANPGFPIGIGSEGWIKLQFSITADGSTDNIKIIDVMPEGFSTGPAINAVKAWTFQPAILDGTALDWHNNIVVINYDLPEIPNLSGPRFTTPYEEIQELINAGQYDRAERQAVTNLKEETFSLHDIGLGNVQLALVEIRRQDLHQALQAITRATIPEVNQLTIEELDVALQYRFTIELSLGRFMDAINTYELRNEIVEMAEDDTIHQQAEQLQMLLDQNYTLIAKGKILDSNKGWFFIPSLRNFTIADIDGELESIDVVCNRNLATLPFQPDIEWSLPESWGDCSLTINGDMNTTFSFYELQD